MEILLLLKTKILSFVIRNIPGDYYDNSSKFFHIYKIWNNIKLDEIKGDYFEFGIYKGKSLYHSFKTARKLGLIQRKFWGLDSFEGFPFENHSFYRKENFQVSHTKVESNFKKYKNIKIKKGFFEKVLTDKEVLGVKQISFAFIDCDIFESSESVFKFLKTRMAIGGFVMIDDFTSLDKNGNSIAKSFSNHFQINKDVTIFGYYSNGIIFRILNL